MAQGKTTSPKKTPQRRSASGQGQAERTASRAAATIQAWEDDPANNKVVARPIPEVGKKPLAYNFPGRAPKAGSYARGTPEFRFWTAAEALRRGADLFARLAPAIRWQRGPVLDVLLDVGEQLNANYNRKALNFYHGPDGAGGTVYSGESPDILCHEMGHAILDAIKPQLWNAAALEVAAFHESFGDISAILSALQLPSLRTAVLSDTAGHVGRSSRLSRLAEQLGAAIRARYPDAVDPDCLRNAVNSFSYSSPANLPTSAPAGQLSAESHSFSRLFTGASFEILAALASQRAGQSAPSEQDLLQAGDDLVRILLAAIQNCAVVSNWYAQLAAAMVQSSAAINAAYPALLKAVFARRAILSLHSAAAVSRFGAPQPVAAMAARRSAAAMTTEMALPADHLGLDAPLLVQAPAEPAPFTAMAMVAHESAVPLSAGEAARTFVDDLFRRGRVDYAEHGHADVALVHTNREKSHRLVKEPRGYRLERVFFDCRFCAGH